MGPLQAWQPTHIMSAELQVARLGKPTLIYIEIKREAGSSGDAQQQGMACYVQDCVELAAATTHTLLPALLLTVRSNVVFLKEPLCASTAAVPGALGAEQLPDVMRAKA